MTKQTQNLTPLDRTKKKKKHSQLGRSKEIIFIQWLNDHCDREGSHLGQNRAASNPRVPARSPGLAPRALTRPPTGPITRGKTNKGSYYTLLMKDTRGEGGGKLDTTGTKEYWPPLHPTNPPHPCTPKISHFHMHACLRAPAHCGGAWLEGVGGGRERSGASWPVNWVSPLKEHVAQQGLAGGPRRRSPSLGSHARRAERETWQDDCSPQTHVWRTAPKIHTNDKM